MAYQLKERTATGRRRADRGSTWGDRVFQILLLIIVAWGVISAVGIAREASSSGGLGVAPGGGPGGVGPAAGPGPAGRGTAETAESSVAVETTESTVGTIAEVIRLNGEVVPQRSVTAYSDVAGEVVDVLVEEGSVVAVGDQIATVDPSTPGERYTYSAVYTTISGTVTDVGVSVGTTVSTSTPVAVVEDLTRLEVEVAIPERYISTATVGMRAELSVPAYPGQSFPAVVRRVSPVLDRNSRTLTAYLEVRDGGQHVRSGMFASVLLETDVAEAVVSVPIGAVTEYYGEPVVWVVTDEGTARRRDVTVGLSSDDAVEIVDGLTVGETVIIAGLARLTDGAAVRVVDTTGHGEDPTTEPGGEE